MRFNEFNILLEDANNAPSSMDQLIDKALETADTSPTAAQKTLQLIADLTNKVYHIVQQNTQPAAEPEQEPAAEVPPEAEPEVAPTEEPTAAEVPPEDEPELSGEEELTESDDANEDVEDYLIRLNSLRNIVANNPAALAEFDAAINSVNKKLDVVQKQAYATGMQAGKEQAMSEYSSLDKYVSLMLKRMSVKPNSEKMLVATIKSIFQDDHISTEDAKVFLEAAAEGSIIDMIQLLEAGKGNIRDFVRPDLLGTFDKVIDDFFKLDLGSSTGGNIGPGEIAFVLLGSPTEKVKKGDLKIGNEKFEVKSSGIKSGSKGKSGSVFGGDHISTAKALWPEVKKIFARYGIHRTEETKSKDGKTKKSPLFKLNSKGLAQYNDAFSYNQMDVNARANLLADIALILYPDAENPERLTKRIAKILSKHSGELVPNNNSEFMRLLAKLALEVYRRDESKDNFIYFNQSTKNFHVYRGDELEQELSAKDGDLEVMRGIDWNDGQYKASPGLYLK